MTSFGQYDVIKVIEKTDRPITLLIEHYLHIQIQL
jgi:hypothetical protein